MLTSSSRCEGLVSISEWDAGKGVMRVHLNPEEGDRIAARYEVPSGEFLYLAYIGAQEEYAVLWEVPYTKDVEIRNVGLTLYWKGSYESCMKNWENMVGDYEAERTPKLQMERSAD